MFTPVREGLFVYCGVCYLLPFIVGDGYRTFTLCSVLAQAIFRPYNRIVRECTHAVNSIVFLLSISISIEL